MVKIYDAQPKTSKASKAPSTKPGSEFERSKALFQAVNFRNKNDHLLMHRRPYRSVYWITKPLLTIDFENFHRVPRTRPQKAEMRGRGQLLKLGILEATRQVAAIGPASIPISLRLLWPSAISNIGWSSAAMLVSV